MIAETAVQQCGDALNRKLQIKSGNTHRPWSRYTVKTAIVSSPKYSYKVMRIDSVRYHCGGWPEEVNSCVLNSYMVYL
jgi:hypothetical protein